MAAAYCRRTMRRSPRCSGGSLFRPEVSVDDDSDCWAKEGNAGKRSTIEIRTAKPGPVFTVAPPGTQLCGAAEAVRPRCILAGVREHAVRSSGSCVSRFYCQTPLGRLHKRRSCIVFASLSFVLVKRWPARVAFLK